MTIIEVESKHLSHSVSHTQSDRATFFSAAHPDTASALEETSEGTCGEPDQEPNIQDPQEQGVDTSEQEQRTRSPDSCEKWQKGAFFIMRPHSTTLLSYVFSSFRDKARDCGFFSYDFVFPTSL